MRTDRLEERQALDIAHRAADLDEDEVEAVIAGADEVFNGVSHMRNDLDRGAEEIAAPLLGDDLLVDAAGGDVVLAVGAAAGEALVVAEVEIGLGSVIGDEDLAMLVGMSAVLGDLDPALLVELEQPVYDAYLEGLRDAGCEVAHTFVVFHYGIFPQSVDSLKAEGVDLHGLATWWDMLAAAEGRTAETLHYVAAPGYNPTDATTLPNGDVLLVRDFYAMAQSDFWWSDIAAGVPYQNLTAALVLRGVSFEFRAPHGNTTALWSFGFFIGSALAGAAGILASVQQPSIDPLMGIAAGLKAFVAAVLGGIGSLTGAVVGGLLIGVLEALVVGYLSPTYRDPIVFGVLILILLFRPAGLLGRLQPEKV